MNFRYTCTCDVLKAFSSPCTTACALFSSMDNQSHAVCASLSRDRGEFAIFIKTLFHLWSAATTSIFDHSASKLSVPPRQGFKNPSNFNISPGFRHQAVGESSLHDCLFPCNSRNTALNRLSLHVFFICNKETAKLQTL